MAAGAQSNKMSYFHAFVMIALMLCGRFLPTFGQVTPLGMEVFGVFLGLVYGWIFVGILWPSVLGFFTLALTGYMTPLQAFVAGFTNPTTTMVMIAFVFAYALGKIGVSNAIAYWTLSRKCFVNRPWLLVTSLVGIAVLMGILGGSFAAIFLLWTVIIAIAEANKMEKGHMLVSMLLALVLYGGLGAGQMVPFHGGVIMYGGFLTKATGIVVEGWQFLVVGEVYTILSVLAIIAIIKYVFRVDASKFYLTEEMRQKYAEYKFTTPQKVGLVLLVAYFLALILPTVFHDGAFWQMLRSWGIVGVTVLYLVVFAIWKDKDGKPICDMDDCWQQGVTWAPIMLFMVTIPLSMAMESPEVGIIATVTEWIAPIFSGMSPTMMLIVMLITMGLLTQVLHNLVVAAIFIPILAPIFIDMGGNPITFFFVIYAALCCAFGSPAASMQAGLIFGHKDIPTSHGYILGWLFLLVTFVIVIAMIPMCNYLFAPFMP